MCIGLLFLVILTITRFHIVVYSNQLYQLQLAVTNCFSEINEGVNKLATSSP